MSSFRAASGLSVVWTTERGPAAKLPTSERRVPAVIATVVRTKQRRDISMLIRDSSATARRPIGGISSIVFSSEIRLFIPHRLAMHHPEVDRFLITSIFNAMFAHIQPCLGLYLRNRKFVRSPAGYERRYSAFHRYNLPNIKLATTEGAAMASITLTVNGETRTVTTDPTTQLLYVLRDELQLNSPRFGCD